MRLLTYNIHKGIGGRDRRYRLERICHVIEHENPDLILLQEVTKRAARCGHDDQPSLFCDRFKFSESMFQENVHYRIGGYGNLLLSRWPIVEKHQISLRLRKKKPRGAQIAVVDTPEGKVKVVNLHLGLAEAERAWQIHHLLHHAAFRHTPELPELIVGDFNDWRNRLTHGDFAEAGFAQITTPPSKFRSFPAWFAIGSLDKAFCRQGIGITEARIVTGAHARVASDHLPLVIDFHLVSRSESSQ
jgi:endonuclease/exonuclease/phosphatase family metal-dependent hydrolase